MALQGFIGFVCEKGFCYGLQADYFRTFVVFFQPLLTTITFTLIFGNVAQLSTDGAPKIIFYMAGITLWNYFSSCLTTVSGVFNANAGIFGKVYFPRLIMLLAVVISNLMKFGVHFLLFVGFVVYFTSQNQINPNSWILLTPLIIVLMALISMGIGLILSSMTTKYKHLNQLIGFGVQLFMYATTVIYPSSSVPLDYLMVVDNRIPIFITSVAPVIFIDFENIPQIPNVVAESASGEVTVVYEEETIEGDCASTSTIFRKWTATDACGNVAFLNQEIHLSCGVKVYNAVTPNGDGKNDIFYLEGIECYQNNKVEIYNRFGSKVYETVNYDNKENVFSGVSDSSLNTM